MSSNCPPQLQLTIQPNATSFKRSFEQFGFDLESPVGGGATDAGASGATNNGRNERNKRARSASSFGSETSSDLSSDTIASRSSDSSGMSQPSGIGALAASTTSIEPPRLPTPEIQDIEMPDYPREEQASFSPAGSVLPVPMPQAAPVQQGHAQQSEERYRLSLERFNVFDSEISALRQSQPVSPVSTLSSPAQGAVPQTQLSPTPPPTLPPLRHRLLPGDMAFFRRYSPPTSPLSDTFFSDQNGHDESSPTAARDHSNQRQDDTASPASTLAEPQARTSESGASANQNALFRFPFRGSNPFPLSLPNLNLELDPQSSTPPVAGINSSSSSSSSASSSASSSGGDQPEPLAFRERLDTALERLRSRSPLVPGLGIDGEAGSETRGEFDEQQEELERAEDDDDEPNRGRARASSSSAQSSQRQSLAPTLPPIPTIADGYEADVDISSTQQVHLQRQAVPPTVPPNPPTLPPIPPITTDLDPADRAWHGREELFTQRFDEFMGLDGPTDDTAPSPSGSRASISSPRRSAAQGGGSSSFSAIRNRSPNASLGDHPLPSPILRDLHSWIEERQPLFAGHVTHGLTLGDDTSSVSSISTTAATAGTERDNTLTSMSTAAAGTSAAASSSGPTSRPEHFVRMIERMRTDRRLEEWNARGGRRPPPPPSWSYTPDASNANAPSTRSQTALNTSDRDVLGDWFPLYNGETSTRSIPTPTTTAPSASTSTFPFTAQAAAHPNTNTTPSSSPGLSLNSPSFWEPIFTGVAGEATAPSATGSGSGAGRPWYSARQRPDEDVVRSLDQGFGMGVGFGDRPAGSAANSPPRILPFPRPETGATPSYFSYMSRLGAGAGGSTVNPADITRNRDRRINDPGAAIWHALEPSDLPLNFHFSSSSTPNSNSNNETETARPSYASVMRDVFGLSQLPTLNLDAPQGGPSSRLPGTNSIGQPAQPRHEQLRNVRERLGMEDENHTSLMEDIGATVTNASGTDLFLGNMERREDTLALMEMLEMNENAGRPRSPMPSSLSDWNGQSTQQVAPQSQSRTQTQPPQSSSTTDAARQPSMIPSDRLASSEFRRGEPLYLRHRLRSYQAQARPGSSNSLVAENASEVRRWADHAELTRGLPGDQRPRFYTMDTDTDVMDDGDRMREAESQLRETPWRNTESRVNRWRDRALITSNQPDTPQLHLPRAPSSAAADPVGENTDMFSGDFISTFPLPSLGMFVDNLSPGIPTSTAGNAEEFPASSTGASISHGPSWLNHPSGVEASHDSGANTSINASSTIHFRLPTPVSARTNILDLDRTDSSSGTSMSSSNDQEMDSDRQSNVLGTDTGPSQMYRGDAPSLPPPDLGSNFDAERHSQSFPTSWQPVDDPMGELTQAAAATIPASAQNTTNDSNSAANNFNPSRLSPHPVSLTYLRRLREQDPDDEQVRLRRLIMDERDNQMRAERRFYERRQQLLASTSAARARDHPSLNRASDGLFHSNPTTMSRPIHGSTAATSSTPATSNMPATSFASETSASRPSIGELRRATAADAGRYAYFDPRTFTAGPFRNTLQHVVSEREGHSGLADRPGSNWPRSTARQSPPYIPPLSFDQENEPLLSPSMHSGQRGVASGGITSQVERERAEMRAREAAREIIRARQLRMREREAPISALHAAAPNHPVHQSQFHSQPRSRSTAIHDFESHIFPTPRPTLSSAVSGEGNNVNNSTTLRSSGASARSAGAGSGYDAMHRYISQQVRMEASRLDDPLHPISPQEPHSSSTSAVDPIRPDNVSANMARSQQLIQRYHREREMDGRRQDIFTPRHANATAHAQARPWRESSLATAEIPNRTARAMSSSADDGDDTMGGDSLTAQRARTRRRFIRTHQDVVLSFSRLPGSGILGGLRRGRAIGDYIRDEDFDDSYETLVSLGMQIGDAKPRATPSEVVEKMEKALYKDWATEGSDTRCPICLDDYEPTDPVQKLSNCSHWLHQECLNQWLQTANTCPVCRGSVNTSNSSGSGSTRMPRYHRGPVHPFGGPMPRRRRDSSPTAPARRPVSIPPRRDAPPADPNTANRGGQGRSGAQDGSDTASFPWRLYEDGPN